jgi:apolipoprotein N-acyltransferase
VSIICGLFFGVLGILYFKLRRDNIFDIFLLASLWVIFEWLRQIFFLDFDYTTISYTAYAINPLLSFASIGGIYIVSFILVLINGFITYFIMKGIDKKFKVVFVSCFIIFLSIFIANKIYLNSGNHNGHEVSFSSIQANGDYLDYSKMENEILILNPQTTNLIYNAFQKQPDYIIYPYNLVSYITVNKNSSFKGQYISTTFEDINKALSKIIPQNTKFVFWGDTMREGEGNNIFDEAVFYENGSTTNYYQKRNLHPFYDVTTDYFRKNGIINYPYDFTPSKQDYIVYIGKERFGNLSCSELNYSFLGRHESRNGANIILSQGVSTEFEKIVLGKVIVVTAQYRAAETNLPLIRSDMHGPSVLINKDGTVNLELKTYEGSVLYGKLFVEDSPVMTLYTYWGDYFFIGLLFVYIFYAIFIKYKNTK